MTQLRTDFDSRLARLRQLRLGELPDRQHDDFAAQLGEAAGFPFAMVNLTNGSGQQYFSGLYVSPAGHEILRNEGAEGLLEHRTMPPNQGFCPYVLEREGRPLPLPDVTRFSRFAGNDVVNQLNIHAYFGEGLIDARTGTLLGTVCIVDTETRPPKQRDEVMRLVHDQVDRVMRHTYQTTGGGPR